MNGFLRMHSSRSAPQSLMEIPRSPCWGGSISSPSSVCCASNPEVSPGAAAGAARRRALGREHCFAVLWYSSY